MDIATRHATVDRIVAWTTIDGVEISTIAWEQPPHEYETAGFHRGLRHPDSTFALWHWPDLEEALDGHAWVVEAVTEEYQRVIPAGFEAVAGLDEWGP